LRWGEAPGKPRAGRCAGELYPLGNLQVKA
jgi:hypothetical protein